MSQDMIGKRAVVTGQQRDSGWLSPIGWRPMAPGWRFWTRMKQRGGDDAGARREKVRTALTTLDPALNDTTPYLFGPPGIQETPDPLAQMDPHIRQRRTIDTIKSPS